MPSKTSDRNMHLLKRKAENNPRCKASDIAKMMSSIPEQLSGIFTNLASIAELQDYHNQCSGYGTKQSDGEVPGMRSTLSLPSLPVPLWPGVIVPDRVLFMGQIDQNC